MEFYEGYFLNGLGNGKERVNKKDSLNIYGEYNFILRFEGDFRNGYRHWNGIIYDNNLQIKEYFRNLDNYGNRKLYDIGGIKFDCEYLFGKEWNINLYGNEGELRHEIKEGIRTVKEKNGTELNNIIKNIYN